MENPITIAIATAALALTVANVGEDLQVEGDRVTQQIVSTFEFYGSETERLADLYSQPAR